MPGHRTPVRDSSVVSTDKHNSAIAEAINRTVAIKVADRGAAVAADAVQLPSWDRWITATATRMVGTSTERDQMDATVHLASSSRILLNRKFRPSPVQKRLRATKLSAL